MANSTITNVDLGSIILESDEFRDDLLTFAAAGTVAEGTILARSSTSGNLIPFVKGGTAAGNGIPKTVLTYEVTTTAAGNEPIRSMVAGKVRSERLVIAADGDATNIDNVVRDQLRDYGIVPIDVEELNIIDNQ